MRRFNPISNRVGRLRHEISTEIKQRTRPAGEVFILDNGYANPAMHYGTFSASKFGFHAFGTFYGTERPVNYPSEYTNGEGFSYSKVKESELFELYCPAHDAHPDACGCSTGKRKRKTRDYYAIEQYTGTQYKWEEVNAEETREDAIRSVREYRENQPEYPVRLRKRREKID